MQREKFISIARESLLVFCFILGTYPVKSAVVTFEHDPLNRLTNATYSDGSRESYSIDVAGNRLSRITSAAPDVIPPSIPTNLVSLAVSSSQLNIAWNRAYDTGGSALAGYRIYVNGTQSANTASTNYLLTGLQPNTQYCITVAAYDHSGNASAQSSSLCLTTPIAIATSVSWYFYPCSLPDVTVTEFATARDNLLTAICFGVPLSTHTRVGTPTGIEIRPVFDATDMTTSSNSYLWRGTFNPPAPYTFQHGQRIYCPVLLIGRNGKVSLDRFQYRVTCGIASFDNQSSFSGSTYSVSRVGLQAGPDGVLFTPDDIIIKSGSGTNLMDAIAFIGGRIGAQISQPSDYNPLNSAISPSGTFITFDYQFVSPTGILDGYTTLWLYPQNQIPSSFNRIVPFQGPNGMLFSVVGPANSPAMTLKSARKITGPWVTETTTAVEGTSSFMYFTGSQGGQGFIRLVPNN